MGKREEAIQRFVGYVRLSAMDKPFISRAEERRLLEHGISSFELGHDDAKGVLLAVAQANNISVERDIDRRMIPILERFGGRRKKIAKKKFREAAAIYKGLAGGTLTDVEARFRVKRTMEENGFRPRRAGFFFSRRWYDKIGRRRRSGDGSGDPSQRLIERT